MFRKYENLFTALPMGGKVDINTARMEDYKEMTGMYPTVADKIASNGPYKSVKDIYKIRDFTGEF